jgi:hypothetical protein
LVAEKPANFKEASVPNNPSNQVILDRMLAQLRRTGEKAALVQAPVCAGGFSIEDFTVTYPNNELIANVAITGVPPGVTLLGVTVAATAGPSQQGTYCMGVASDSAGLAVPLSVLAASTSPSFPSPTVLTGLVILYYVQDGTTQECVTTQQFTVGG